MFMWENIGYRIFLKFDKTYCFVSDGDLRVGDMEDLVVFQFCRPPSGEEGPNPEGPGIFFVSAQSLHKTLSSRNYISEKAKKSQVLCTKQFSALRAVASPSPYLEGGGILKKFSALTRRTVSQLRSLLAPLHFAITKCLQSRWDWCQSDVVYK